VYQERRKHADRHHGQDPEGHGYGERRDDERPLTAPPEVIAGIVQGVSNIKGCCMFLFVTLNAL
jgi:hypothetical protein